MSPKIIAQIANTYARIDESPRNLDRDVREWWAEEDSTRYRLGVPDMSLRPALIYLVEAARQLNGMNREGALELLNMATEQIKGENIVPTD